MTSSAVVLVSWKNGKLAFKTEYRTSPPPIYPFSNTCNYHWAFSKGFLFLKRSDRDDVGPHTHTHTPTIMTLYVQGFWEVPFGKGMRVTPWRYGVEVRLDIWLSRGPVGTTMVRYKVHLEENQQVLYSNSLGTDSITNKADRLSLSASVCDVFEYAIMLIKNIKSKFIFECICLTEWLGTGGPILLRHSIEAFSPLRSMKYFRIILSIPFHFSAGSCRNSNTSF